MKILVYQLDEQKFFKASSRRFINVTKILISENCIFWHHFYKLSIWKSAITKFVTFNRRTSYPLIEKKRKKISERYTVEPRYNEPPYNGVLGITIFFSPVIWKKNPWYNEKSL